MTQGAEQAPPRPEEVPILSRDHDEIAQFGSWIDAPLPCRRKRMRTGLDHGPGDESDAPAQVQPEP